MGIKRDHTLEIDANQVAVALIGLLREKGLSLATAESCTGGLVGKILTDVPGSSEVYLGGWIVYANKMKCHQLGVASSLIDEHGAVSRPVACAMAQGAINLSGADLSVAVTGVAGPGGGTNEKPVGTVWMAIGNKIQLNPAMVEHGEGSVEARLFEFLGDRHAVRHQAAEIALEMLRLTVLGESLEGIADH